MRVREGLLLVWWLVICDAIDIVGCHKRTPGLYYFSKAPLYMKQDTNSIDMVQNQAQILDSDTNSIEI